MAIEMIFTTVTTALRPVECGKCGGVYAILGRRYDACREKGDSWTCPYCRCTWGFGGGGENARLKKELEQERNRLAAEVSRHDQTKAELRTANHGRAVAAGKLNKMKQRASAGVCPCCNRTVSQLARHMKSKHPDYAQASR